MKRTFIRAIAVLSLIASFSMVSAYAQAPGRLKFEAPFAFTVGNKTLPAGKYSIQRLRFDTTDILVIRSDDNKRVVNFRVNKNQLSAEPEYNKLIFSVYGDKHFLRKIQYITSNIGYELLRSRSEREMIKKAKANNNNLAAAETTLELIAISGQ